MVRAHAAPRAPEQPAAVGWRREDVGRPRPARCRRRRRRATSRAAVALADEAAAGGARLVALPEYLQYRGADDGFRASARPIPGPHTEPFAEVARRRGAWILVGSPAETSADPQRPYNTSALIAPDGSIAATYRKIHLFDVAVDAGPPTPSRRG